MKKLIVIMVVALSLPIAARADGLRDFMRAVCRGYDPGFKPVVALKTNLLLYPVLMPNLELETYLGRRVTLNIEGQYAWWARPKQLQYYRFAAAGAEVRYWFIERARFHGHYFGAYGNFGIYDLASGNGLGFQGHSTISAGLSYGYMMPIGRRLSLEFGIGVGYVSSEYKSYYILPEYNLYRDTERLNYWGVTKAKISLVWLLGKNRLHKSR